MVTHFHVVIPPILLTRTSCYSFLFLSSPYSLPSSLFLSLIFIANQIIPHSLTYNLILISLLSLFFFPQHHIHYFCLFSSSRLYLIILFLFLSQYAFISTSRSSSTRSYNLILLSFTSLLSSTTLYIQYSHPLPSSHLYLSFLFPFLCHGPFHLSYILIRPSFTSLLSSITLHIHYSHSLPSSSPSSFHLHFPFPSSASFPTYEFRGLRCFQLVKSPGLQ